MSKNQITKCILPQIKRLKMCLLINHGSKIQLSERQKDTDVKVSAYAYAGDSSLEIRFVLSEGQC